MRIVAGGRAEGSDEMWWTWWPFATTRMKHRFLLHRYLSIAASAVVTASFGFLCTRLFFLHLDLVGKFDEPLRSGNPSVRGAVGREPLSHQVLLSGRKSVDEESSHSSKSRPLTHINKLRIAVFLELRQLLP